jgi:hypothetical protein
LNGGLTPTQRGVSPKQLGLAPSQQPGFVRKPLGGLIGGHASVESHGEQMRNGGQATALANAQRRRKRNEDDQGAYTTEGLEGGNTQYAIYLGLGVPKKPKYDLLELGKQMDDAIRRECFKEGIICFPVRKKRKAIVALSTDFKMTSKCATSACCTVWKQRVKSWPGGW